MKLSIFNRSVLIDAHVRKHCDILFFVCRYY